ncbi:MAG: pectate lyase, partial [Treponema sp.]|nr:pectate lyase [Treponema sp.]
MKKSFLRTIFMLLLAGTVVSGYSQANRKPWKDVPNPTITSIETDAAKPTEVIVKFKSETPRDNSGADKAEIIFTGPEKKTGTVGKTRNTDKSVTVELSVSGTYTVTVYAIRNGESEKHASESKEFKFTLPLVKPSVSTRNLGGGKVNVKWNAVDEAEGYVLNYTEADGSSKSLPATKALSADINLKAGQYSKISVTAVRGSDKAESDVINKLVKDELERVWTFTEFGTSTNPERNRYEMLDPNDLKVKLYSCTVDPKGNIIDKGGKFESFFDGISFYYTVIDPKKENFELTATVTVDYHNPIADGQEGFGLLALDRLGVDGEPMIIAYNNSAGVISRKFTTHVNGAKKEIKNGVGARFVSGITDEIIKKGDAGIKASAESKSFAYSYDQSSDAVKTGDVYRVTLKKDNTGYHAIYKKDIESEGYKNTFTMYDNENVKLLQLDKNHIYLGFAVARGCNATFSDVVLKITDPKKDPPAIPEPPELVPLKTTIDCPSTWYDNKYPFVFNSNTQGTVSVKNSEGKFLIKNDKVKPDVDYKKVIKIDSGLNDLIVTFDPDDKWTPGPKKAVGQWNPEILDYEQDYRPVSYTHSVTSMTYKGEKNTLYVSPNGNALGDGTKNSPLDIMTAVQFSKPGQTIVLLKGTYYPTKGIEIERGNSGTAKQRKTLVSEPGSRAIINFSQAKVTVTAFNIFGDYWTIKNIDITRSPDDVKAVQVGGCYNELMMVDTYLNGDTGIQIAGRSAELPSKWPHHNLIYGCESFGNSDPAQNNADGFASKLTSGEGNVFRNCISHHNVDDGWDLYAKVETGPIGAVLLDNCITYANGTKLDGTGKGDGNGFKMGGDGINVPHILRNSISWGNGVNGVTCNSNPGLILDRVTVFGNGGYNIALYGKGDAKQYPRTFKTTGIISLNGGAGDNYRERPDLLAKDT